MRKLLVVAVSLFCVPSAIVAAEPEGCPAAAARVYLTSAGEVTLNGQKVEVSKLKDALLALKPTPPAVCYSRDNPSGEPHVASKEVMDAIIAVRLPVGMFTDSTFKTFAK